MDQETKELIKKLNNKIDILLNALVTMGKNIEIAVEKEKIENSFENKEETNKDDPRSKFINFLNIIDNLKLKLGEDIEEEEILAEAENQGIKTEEGRKIIKKLTENGCIFEYKKGVFRRV